MPRSDDLTPRCVFVVVVFWKAQSGALCQTLEKLSGELGQIERTLTVLLKGKKDKDKMGYWTQVATRVNRIFFIFYLAVVSLFLAILFSKWT